MNVQLEKHLIIGIAVIIGASFINATPVEAGILGLCPNLGGRCYLEINGKFNDQPGEQPYFAGGWKDAACWCASKCSQSINRGPDYCAF